MAASPVKTFVVARTGSVGRLEPNSLMAVTTISYSVPTSRPSSNLSSRPSFWNFTAAENWMKDRFAMAPTGWKVTLYVMSLKVFQMMGWRNVTVIDWGLDPSAMTSRGGLGGSENQEEVIHRQDKG